MTSFKKGTGDSQQDVKRLARLAVPLQASVREAGLQVCVFPHRCFCPHIERAATWGAVVPSIFKRLDSPTSEIR